MPFNAIIRQVSLPWSVRLLKPRSCLLLRQRKFPVQGPKPRLRNRRMRRVLIFKVDMSRASMSHVGFHNDTTGRRASFRESIDAWKMIK